MTENDNLQNKIDIIKSSELFKEFTDDEINKIAANSYIIYLKSNTKIIEEGEKSKDLYIIIEGCVDVLKWNSQYQMQFVLTSLESGASFGEMSFLKDISRSATILTVTPTKLIKFSYDQLDSHADLAAKIKYRLAINQVDLITNMNNNFVKNIEEKELLIERKNKFLTGYIYLILQLLLFFSIFSIFFKEVNHLLVWITAPICFIFFSRHKNFKLITEILTINKNKAIQTLQLSIFIASILLTFYSIFNIYFLQDKNFHLFSFVRSLKKYDWLLMIGYAFSQELIGRGVFQHLLALATNDERGYRPIFYSSIMLCSLSLFLEKTEIFQIFLLSLSMGMLYRLTNNLYVNIFLHAFMLLFGMIKVIY